MLIRAPAELIMLGRPNPYNLGRFESISKYEITGGIILVVGRVIEGFCQKKHKELLSELKKAVPDCTWLYPAVTGCTWLYLAVPGSA